MCECALWCALLLHWCHAQLSCNSETAYDSMRHLPNYAESGNRSKQES
jgi:hypothetical protein